MSKDTIRLSFLSDIMFEKYVLKKNPEKTNFDSFFIEIEDLLKDSDVIVGNVETTFAGKEAGYTKEMYSFNTPDKAIESLKKLGLDYAIISNNHIYDRGIAGRKRTIELLEKSGIHVLGKTHDKVDKIEIEGISLSILPFTSTSNYYDTKLDLSKKEEKEIGLLAPYDFWLDDYQAKSFKSKIYVVLSKTLGPENLKKALKMANRKPTHPSTDNIKQGKEELLKPYIDDVKDKINKAKDLSNLVIIHAHMGGQFNKEPGTFSKLYMDIFKEEKVDAIIGNHPHIIQEFNASQGIPAFFSTGNFSMAPNSTYIIMEDKPDIGLIVHFDISKSSKSIERILVTPIKMIYDGDFRVVPLKNIHEDRVLFDWLQKRLKTELIYHRENEYIIK